MSRSAFLHCVGVFLAAFAAALSASASFGQDFYRNKTITILVGYTPGGGYDSYARALAQFLPDHVAGRPTVIVQNMPGAASLTAARSIDRTEPKDGTFMVTFNPGLITQSLVQPDRVNTDFKRYAWLGVVTPDVRVCLGYGPKGPKTFDEVMKRKEFILASTGKGATDYVNGATLREVLHAPVRQVLGFPGSADERLAVERGEVDGECGSWSSVPLSWIQKGDAHPFVRFTRETSADIPATAVFIDELAKSQSDKDLLDVLDTEDEIGRSFVVSRDVPADRLAILRKGFDDTMKDPRFLAEMKKENLPVNPVSGTAVGAILDKILSAPKPVIERAKQIYE